MQRGVLYALLRSLICPNQIKSNQIKSNQIKSNQIKSNQIKSNLSSRLKGLEDELKVLLFQRQNRSMELTQSGADFYEKTKPILNELEKSVQDVSRIILKFMDLYPKVSVEILTSGDHKNLIEQHIDVAIRISETSKDSDLIARPFQSSSFSFYASPDYISKNGLPTSPRICKTIM
ncbi:MAG: DNA-binding transcriptional LysR family regulator [Moritella sp.]